MAESNTATADATTDAATAPETQPNGDDVAIDAVTERLAKMEAADTDGGEQADAQGDTDGEGKPDEDAQGGDAQPEAPTLSERQEQALKAAGMDPADVLAMGDKGLALADKLVEQRRKFDQLAGRLGDAEVKLKTAQPAKEPPAPLEGFKLDEDDWDDLGKINEKLATPLNDLLRRVHAAETQLAEMSQGYQAIRESETATREAYRQETAAKFFDGLDGRIWKGMDDPAGGARQDVLALADTLIERADAKGQDLTLAQALDRALAATDPETYSRAAQTRRAADAARGRRGSPELPTGRQAAKLPPTTEEAVIAKTAERVAQLEG